MKKPPSLYVQTVAHLCISGGKGALLWVRWCGAVWRKVRCWGCAGVEMCGGGCAAVGAFGVVMGRRGCAAVGALVWRCVEDDALRRARAYGGGCAKVRKSGGGGAEMCGGRCAVVVA